VVANEPSHVEHCTQIPACASREIQEANAPFWIIGFKFQDKYKDPEILGPDCITVIVEEEPERIFNLTML
jgi:hypothetical protein